jgi:dolichol-phosphate hexosyltransferase
VGTALEHLRLRHALKPARQSPPLAGHLGSSSELGEAVVSDTTVSVADTTVSIADTTLSVADPTVSVADSAFPVATLMALRAPHERTAGGVRGPVPPTRNVCGRLPGIGHSLTNGQIATTSVDSPHRRESLPAVSYARRMKLSILMPVYNEERTVAHAVASVLSASYPCDIELIIVDDGSSDSTGKILETLKHPNATVVTHPRNHGKGASLQTAAKLASGTHLVPFDADLEYDPADLTAMLRPVLEGRCDVVFGARLFGANTRYQSYRHALANRALTFTANVLFDSYLSDMHTCLKLLPIALFDSLQLSESRFGLDTEITAKLLKRGIRPFEVPVAYHSRSCELGKKIGWRDGVECVQVLTRVRFAPHAVTSMTGAQDPLEAVEDSVKLLADLA